MTSGAHSNMGQSSPPATSVPPSSSGPASPPNKRDLKSWWKNFKLPMKQQDTHHDTRGPGIFGVPLRTSITYANVAISLVDENGKSYIYGYVPIVVAKCGVFLKEKATSIEGIFRLSGSEKRIKELKIIFDSPDRYGKGLSWDGYTVHDAANVLRRYLNDLPEPVVPLDLYEKFRDPLRGATKQAVGDAEGPQFVDNFDETTAIEKYQDLITELPPLNKQLLLYILDLLAVFAAKSDENRMTSQNLAAIFQPGMLSHPAHAMAPDEYRLNQCVIIFLIENQDHFLIGMQGTAADETMMREVALTTQNGPFTPNPNRKSSLGRTASNSSAGAESVLRDGKVRRNRSVSSRHSRVDGSATPKSPSLTTTPTGGLARSNTVPSKKSPALMGGKFNKHGEMSSRLPHSPNLEPLAQSHIDEDHLLVAGWSGQGRRSHSRSQDRLLDVPQDAVAAMKDRNPQNSHNLFQRSSYDSNEKRQPNKLKKKRIPGSINISAQSSSNSLQNPNSTNDSPTLEPAPELMEAPAPASAPASVPHPQSQPIPQSFPSHSSSHFGRHTHSSSAHSFLQRAPQSAQSERYTIFPVDNSHDGPADLHHKHSRVFSHSSLRPEDGSKGGKKSPPQSIHSSYNDGSDMDPGADEVHASASSEHVEKEKKHRWRISKSKKEDFTGLSGSPLMPPHMNIGANYNAEISTTSIGSALNKSQKSFAGDSSEQLSLIGDRAISYDSGKESSFKDDPRGPFSWIKTKYREAKENAEQRRAKSPPPGDMHHNMFVTHRQAPRGKSLDLKREPLRDDDRRTLREVPPDSPVGTSSETGKFAQAPQRETWRNHVSSKSSNAELVTRGKGGSETVITIAPLHEGLSREEVRPRTAESTKESVLPQPTPQPATVSTTTPAAESKAPAVQEPAPQPTAESEALPPPPQQQQPDTLK